MGGQGYYRVLDQMGNQPVHFCRHRNPGDQDCDQCDAVYVYGAQLEYGNSATTYAANTANRYSVSQVTDADYPGTLAVDGLS